MKAIKALVAFAMVLGFSTPAWAAKTYQDKQGASISDDGLVRTSESGTILNGSATVASLDAGNALVTCGTVPTGKMWHITSIGVKYTGTVTNVRVALLTDSNTQDQDGAPTSGEYSSFKGDWWLAAGDTLQIWPQGYTAGDSLVCRYNGLEYATQ